MVSAMRTKWVMTAHQMLYGTLLTDAVEPTNTRVAFKAMDAARWGMVRRYGNRTYMLIAKLSDGRLAQVSLSDNKTACAWLRAKRDQLPHYDRGYCWSANDPGVRVWWLDTAGPSAHNLPETCNSPVTLRSEPHVPETFPVPEHETIRKP